MHNKNLFGNFFCDVWDKLGVSRHFQLATYIVFDVESDSAVRNCQILQGNKKLVFSLTEVYFLGFSWEFKEGVHRKTHKA